MTQDVWTVTEKCAVTEVCNTTILEKNALSKECELFEENCTHTHKKAQVSNYVLLL